MMKTFSKILVGIDMSENCLPAIKVIRKMIAETDSRVTFLYVLHSEGEEVGSFRSLYKREMSADRLISNYVYPRVKEWLTGVDSRLAAKSRLEVRVGSPAEEILQFAEERDFDLIVAGTHGRSGFKRWWIGSVAERVVRQAECPVLTVRSRGEAIDRVTGE